MEDGRQNLLHRRLRINLSGEKSSGRICTDLENYNIYNQTPQHYGQYVPLVHVLNYGNYHGDTLVRFFTITTSVHLLHTSKTSTSLLTMKLLLCFSTDNPRELCASFDVSER